LGFFEFWPLLFGLFEMSFVCVLKIGCWPRGPKFSLDGVKVAV